MCLRSFVEIKKVLAGEDDPRGVVISRSNALAVNIERQISHHTQSCSIHMPLATTIREVGKTDFPVIERLFGANGACSGCWCMFWRMRSNEWQIRSHGDEHYDDFKVLVERSLVHAAIAFIHDEPAGWVTYGPRESFPRVMNSRVLRRDAPAGTWSIVCFYIPRQWRGKGIADQLLGAAVGYCKARGATEVEAFPVEPKDPTRREPATAIYTGVVTQYVKAGFVALPRAGKERTIYIKKL